MTPTTIAAKPVSSLQNSGWRWRAAYWVSQVASPPVLTVATIALAARALATWSAWYWATVYLVVTVGAPCLYVAWLVYTGWLTDMHMPVRRQRIAPLLCTAVCALGAGLLVWVASVPPLLQWLALVNVVQAWFFLLITLSWKISLHSTTAANLAVLGSILLGSAALPLAILVLLVGWARIYLRRHTAAQTVAGALLGATLMAGGFWFYPYW
jgi:membrane-associated phospholipid phosphatase